jgi:type II restriction enzyme
MLADVLKYRDRFERHFPNNRFVDAKIRQSLQVLRDQGLLRFVRPGQYERIDITPVFSPLLDFSVAAPFVSSAQIARVALETWASFNLYCLDCASDALDPLPNNTPVADFKCFVCDRTYQLKAKDGRFGLRITGAAYQPTIDYIRRGEMPEHIFVEFDKRFSTVVFVDAIPGRLITADRVIPRKPLAATARRAGWQGCTIVISDLPSVRMVAPAGIERSKVREKWKAL